LSTIETHKEEDEKLRADTFEQVVKKEIRSAFRRKSSSSTSIDLDTLRFILDNASLDKEIANFYSDTVSEGDVPLPSECIAYLVDILKK
jgi:hypothetical protein